MLMWLVVVVVVLVLGSGYWHSMGHHSCSSFFLFRVGAVVGGIFSAEHNDPENACVLAVSHFMTGGQLCGQLGCWPEFPVELLLKFLKCLKFYSGFWHTCQKCYEKTQERAAQRPAVRPACLLARVSCGATFEVFVFCRF